MKFFLNYWIYFSNLFTFLWAKVGITSFNFNVEDSFELKTKTLLFYERLQRTTINRIMSITMSVVFHIKAKTKIFGNFFVTLKAVLQEIKS